MADATHPRTWQLTLAGDPARVVPAAPRSPGRPRRSASTVSRLSLGLTLRHVDPISVRDRCSAFLVALPSEVAYSHWTAAALLGLPSRSAPVPHITLAPRRVLPQRRELVVHCRELPPGDVAMADGIPVTSGGRLFLDLAEYLTDPDLVVLGDAVLARGLSDPEVMAARVEAGRRRRGVVRARRVLPLLDGRAQSPPESLVRYYLADSRLPTPTPQIPVRNNRGLVVAHGDLGYEEWRIIIEYEGRQHSEAEQFERDIDRYSLMAADGWLVVRFAARHLRRPSVIVDRVGGALLSRGWRPPPLPTRG